MLQLSPGLRMRLLSSGFWLSRALSSSVELRLYETIGRGEWRVERLASALGVESRGLEVLLRFNMAFGLVARLDGGRVALTADAVSLLDRRNGQSPGGAFGAGAMVSDDVWKSFENLTEKVRCGAANDAESYFSSLTEQQTAGFFETMHQQAQDSAVRLALILDLSAAATLLDLGCGPATYSIELLKRNIGLKAMLVDTRTVCRWLSSRLEGLAVQDRITVHEADFWRFTSDVRYDVLLLSKILHDWSDGDCLRLLQSFVGPMRRGDRVIVHEEVIHDAADQDVWPAIIDLFLFCTLGQGKTRTLPELKAMLETVGCQVTFAQRLDEFTTAIVATKV